MFLNIQYMPSTQTRNELRALLLVARNDSRADTAYSDAADAWAASDKKGKDQEDFWAANDRAAAVASEIAKRVVDLETRLAREEERIYAKEAMSETMKKMSAVKAWIESVPGYRSVPTSSLISK